LVSRMTTVIKTTAMRSLFSIYTANCEIRTRFHCAQMRQFTLIAERVTP
jgi:hypothetical protein